MSEVYYIIERGVRKGPINKEDLLANGLEAETMVWRTGLESWVPASQLPELGELLNCPQFTGYEEVRIETEPYFMIVDGIQKGPMTIEELIAAGLTESTMVWQAGMADWQPASTRNDIMNELARKRAEVGMGGNNPYYGPQAAPQQPGYQQPGYQQPNYQQPNYQQPFNNGYNYPRPHTNWQTLAIIATILGFLTSCIGGILGVIGLVQANKANKAYALGDNMTGDSANSTAQLLTIISFVISGISLMVSIGFFFTN